MGTPWTFGNKNYIGEKLSYEEQLRLSDAEIQKLTEQHMERYAKLQKEFLTRTALTAGDMALLMFTAALQSLRWMVLQNDVGRFDSAGQADQAVENVGSYLPANFETLLSDHTVPYDAIARSERFKNIYPDESTGISGANHRYTTLGHDPVAGWLFGTANIATNTLTANKPLELFPSYHIRNQEFYAKTNVVKVMQWSWEMLGEKPLVVGGSFLKQAVHYSTDIFTRQGLPIPMINSLSPEASAFLIGNGIDVYSVTRGIALSLLINKLVEMFHRLFFNPSCDDEKLYEVRTRKIIMYSNTLSSVLNLGYVGLTGNLKALDFGGILVTLWRILTDQKAIRKIEIEFMEKTLDGELQKEEDEVNQRLAKYGFKI